jgi:hypothetical protein
MQSPPQTQEPPPPTGAQTFAMQDPLEQSVLEVQEPPAQFVWQVPLWQFWLVQSPPQLQELPGPTFWHVPPTQDPLVQSALHPHEGIESAHTGAQTPGDPPLRSQNWLLQSPPQVQGVPAQAGVVLRQAIVDVVVLVVAVVVVVEVVVLVVVVVVVVVVVDGTHGVPAHPGQSASWTLTLPWRSGMVAAQALHGCAVSEIPVQPIMSGLSWAAT